MKNGFFGLKGGFFRRRLLLLIVKAEGDGFRGFACYPMIEPAGFGIVANGSVSKSSEPDETGCDGDHGKESLR